MALSIKAIIEEAKARADAANHEEGNLFVMMGTVPSDTPKMLVFREGVVSLNAEAVEETKERGKKIFDKFVKYLKQAVCNDFNYCHKRDEVKKHFDNYLPYIVEAIIKRIPITGKLPQWLVMILGFFKITAASMEGLVILFVGWIMVKGCDELCGCFD